MDNKHSLADDLLLLNRVQELIKNGELWYCYMIRSPITRDICTVDRDIQKRLKAFLFHLSYPDLIFWFASCFVVVLAMILLFRPH